MSLRFVSIPILMLAAVGINTVSSAAPADAAPPDPHYTVCAAGCAYTNIQAAIDAATSGATITIGPGRYVQNITVPTSVTLEGDGGATVLYPAVYNPDPSACVDDDGSFCGLPSAGSTAVSNMILVQANDVTIEDMTLEGDNPALGAGIAARNGIIEDWTSGTWENLTVSNVTVRDIFARGIEAVASTPGETFDFNHDTVANVQDDPAAVAMFNSWGTGVMADNNVSEASDAISANWSEGTQFLYNVISNSASGIHTDNNGGFGGSADLIKGNTIENCMSNGYGIWVFAPYVDPTVTANSVTGCYVGLGAFGSSVATAGPTFSDDVVDGRGAKTTDPTGTYGTYFTTDMLGYGCGDVNATLTASSLQDFTTGLFVTQTTPLYGDTVCGQATVTASDSVIQADGTGANGEPGTDVNAANNWWGCASGPNTDRCDSAIGTVLYTPWLTKPPFVIARGPGVFPPGAGGGGIPPGGVQGR